MLMPNLIYYLVCQSKINSYLKMIGARKKMLNQTEKKLAPTQFVENEIVYEKVTLNLPKNIVDYYSAMAPFQNTNELTLIENDIVEKLNADFEGREGPDWKKIFNLYPALE